MFKPVDISGGQVSGVDDLSSGAPSVVNWETDEAGVNRPRPALARHVLSNFTTSPIIGLCRWKTYIIIVTTDRRIWAVSDFVPGYANALSDSTSATQLGGNRRPTFALGDLAVYIAGGAQIQRWNPSLAYSEVIAASPQCSHIAALGQRLVANVTSSFDLAGTYVWSDIGESTWGTWPAANFSTAAARPDPIVAIYENTNEVSMFGSETLQTFGLGSDPTLPFEQAAVINVGLGAPYAVTRLDNEYALLDDRRRIVITDGRSVQPISDAIQKDLRDPAFVVSDAHAFREERGQQSLIAFRFPASRRTFVYDRKGQKWAERDYYAAPFHADWPASAYVYWPALNYHLFGSSLAAGGLLRFDENSRVDIDGALVSERTTGWQDFGTANRKRSASLRLFMRRGTAAQGATPGALEVRRQTDSQPWSPWKQLSVGTPEDYGQLADTYALNCIFRRCRYGVRFSNTENMSLVSLQDDVTEIDR